MPTQNFLYFFENYGDFVSFLGPVLSTITSIIYWIIFLIHLDKAENLEINSLILRVFQKDYYGKELFIISNKENS